MSDQRDRPVGSGQADSLFGQHLPQGLAGLQEGLDFFVGLATGKQEQEKSHTDPNPCSFTEENEGNEGTDTIVTPRWEISSAHLTVSFKWEIPSNDLP